ncbi:lamin tail domain-containing protein [Streptomyces sp. RY43-2]|uniref:Lamin tail domain-containing protein n=1 Tax=Streptomyces macrolidinus TaxID=2952607 RepID=A0ABT0ZCC4_9ACTN|nr:lamin tail domain-containing protein [Streptomyces macrolidinus]MCN9240526.1 lamin tail domain-containing protein [Streptomyces macrolidinus]
MSSRIPPALRGKGAKAVLVALPIGLTGSLVALPFTAQAAPSSDAVISEVYGGGGNSGASLTHDFIELGNAGSAPLDLGGWSVQYLSGSPGSGTKWQVTPLTGALPAGGSYLVAEAKGAGGDTALPTPDATGTIAMSATSGTVALVHSTTALTCLTAADCAADGTIKDLVGFGTAVVREGSPATGAGNTTSVTRGATLTDTDDNAADFTGATPGPRNSAGDGGSTTPTPTPTPTDTTPGALRIHDIQGTTRISPQNGKTVTNVPGVVTAVRSTGSKGYWIEDTAPDADPATSEGIFVFTGSATPQVKVGDSVLVSGKVSEYYPGGQSSGAQSVTELTGPQAIVLSSGNELPKATVIDASTLPDAYVPQAGGGSIEGLELQPGTYALDWLEAHEGMRVQVTDTRVVGASNDYNETWITTKPQQNPTPRGGTVVTGYTDPNSGRLLVTPLTGDKIKADVGDTLTGTTTGPVDYSNYGGYTLDATSLGQVKSGGLTPEVASKGKSNEVSVATYNVENLAPGDAQSKFDRLAEGVVKNLAAPDVVSLEEIQDNNGATDDGTVAADKTVAKFVDAIKAAGGPAYDWRSIDPVNDQDGGQPGGNIRIVFLFNPERVSFVDRPGGDSTTAVEAVRDGDKGVRLSASPGRIAPTSDAWKSSRKPLVGEFVFRHDNKRFFVIGNHFNSKGGDQPVHGALQPPTLGSEVQRTKQAEEVNGFVASLLAKDAKAKVVVLGDMNDYQYSTPLATLTSGGVLTDLINTLPVNERYSYVYEGNSQTLDHILVSPGIKKPDYDVVHINAEFSDQTSDHDPQVVRFK